MGAKTRVLLEYQEIELQIVDIKRQLARKERQIAAQQKKVADLHASIAAEQQELRKAQMNVDELDVEIKARSAHISKLREQLNSVRTNKEYAAILSQMNNEKADSSKLETRGLELMQALEDRKNAMGAHAATEKNELDRLAALQAEADQTRALYADRLANLESKRSLHAEKIDRESLVQFQRLSERYDGEAMAEVMRTSPRRDDYNCGGCNMSLRTEVANALKIRDDVVTCKNCGRILFMRD